MIWVYAITAILIRPVACNLNASHNPLGVVYIVDGNMFGAAVVPKRDRAVAPAEATGEFWAVAPFHKPV